MIARALMLLACGTIAFARAAGDAKKQAESILNATGVKGGIITHVGCGDGRLTAALHAGDQFLVHGLDSDSTNVETARQHIDSLGLYGKVSAETYDGVNLPYGDNVVNLIVASGECRVAGGEIERVLVPRGVVVLSPGVNAALSSLSPLAIGHLPLDSGWRAYRKPVPSDIDQWTHFMYDASGNAVSKDKRVRYPRHTQWYAGPKFSRHHDALASLSAMTSSKGRLFYIYDEGPVSIMHRPSQWKLIARDAFNGKLLWKRDIPTWMTHLYNFRAGPAELPRRLVSVGDDVYTTLGWNVPAVKLDAATGETRLTYAGSKGAAELLYHNGMLLMVVGNPDRHIETSDTATGYWDWAEVDVPVQDQSIMAFDAAGGKLLWRVDGGNLGRLIPMSLCALGDKVFYLDNKEFHCLDAKTGKPRWTSLFEPPVPGLFVRAYTPTVVAYEDVVMCMTWQRISAHSIADGRKLWEQKGALIYAAAGDLFAIGDKVWTFPMTKGLEMPPATDFITGGKTGVGIDIASGKIVEEVDFARTQHHHRCYRNKATETHFLLGHSGVQVIGLDTKTPHTHRWARGACQYGIMPANGYIYVPPDTCQCYFDGKINGFFALADTCSWADLEIRSAVEKGPAYALGNPKSEISDLRSTDWPTYRGNTARSGAAACVLADTLARKWSVSVGETPTAPVVAAGRAYLADRDGYTVHCLNAENGKEEWKFFAGGAVDSPPTIHKGRCVFGCRDGSVYCLDAGSGELVWRFKTSATERRIGWENRLASPLWIHGSVLIANDTVYFAAGHSSNLDGGIRVYGVDLATGEQRHFTTLASGHWGDDGQWGFLSDILSSEDGSRIGMRQAGFSKVLKRGKGDAMQRATGLLDASWFHRKLWQHGNKRGKLVVFDEDRTVTAGNIYTGLKQRRKVTNLRQPGSKWNQVGHLHQKFTRYLKDDWFPVGTDLVSKGKGCNWQTHEAFQPRAMVLADGKLCVAGWLDAMVVKLKSGRAKDPANPDPRDSVLRIYSGSDGAQLWECDLSSEPVFDGMAVAEGRLYVSTKDGKVTCFEGR